MKKLLLITIISFASITYSIGQTVGTSVGYSIYSTKHRYLTGISICGEIANITLEITNAHHRFNEYVTASTQISSILIGYNQYLKCSELVSILFNPKVGTCSQTAATEYVYKKKNKFEIGLDTGIKVGNAVIKSGITNRKFNMLVGFVTTF
jgi:hypothetical protein